MRNEKEMMLYFVKNLFEEKKCCIRNAFFITLHKKLPEQMSGSLFIYNNFSVSCLM